jgi:hypothetical protein
MFIIKWIRAVDIHLTGGFAIYAILCMAFVFVFGVIDLIVWLSNIF